MIHKTELTASTPTSLDHRLWFQLKLGWPIEGAIKTQGKMDLIIFSNNLYYWYKGTPDEQQAGGG